MNAADSTAASGAPAPVWFSASQVSMYRDCVRKWAWRYLARITSEQTPSQRLGTEVDDEQLQPYLREGRPFDFTRPSGEIAAALLPFLPTPPIPSEYVQKEIRILSSDESFGFLGFVDLYRPDTIPTVTDTKTCGSFDWIRTPATLATDVQAQLYATATFLETGAPAVDLEWLYTRTRGARAARRVHLRVTPEHASAQYDGIHANAEEMLAIRRGAPVEGIREFVLSLPYTASSCSAYGGCPYRHECNLSPSHFRREAMSNASSVLERLKAKRAAEAAGNAPAAATPPTATSAATPPPSPPVMSDRDVPAPEAPPAWTQETKPFTGHNTSGAAPLGINPPEKDLPPAPAAGASSTPPSEDKPKRGRPKKDASPSSETSAAPGELRVVLAFDPEQLAAIVAALKGGAS